MNDCRIECKQGLVHVWSKHEALEETGQNYQEAGILLISVKFAGHEDLFYGITFEIYLTASWSLFSKCSKFSKCSVQGALIFFFSIQPSLLRKKG